MRLFNRNREMADAKGSASRSVIEARLAECTAAMREADSELARLSLQAITTGDDTEALAAQKRLRELENQHALLCSALIERQRQDAERQKELRAAQNVSAKRALAQHSGRFQRDAGDVAKAISDLKDATARLQASGASIIAVLPNHLRTGASPFHELLSADGIAKAIAVEAYRINPTGKPPAPGWEYQDRANGTIQPMVDRLAALCSAIREGFDSAPPPPKPISPVVGDDAPTGIACDGASPVAGDPGVAAQTHSGEFVNLCSPGVGLPIEQAAEPHSEALGEPREPVEAAVEADMASPIERSAQAGVDYTPLFHGGTQ